MVVVGDGGMKMMLTDASGRGMTIVVDGGRIVGVMVHAVAGEWMVGLSNGISVIEGCDRFNVGGDGALIEGCVSMGVGWLKSGGDGRSVLVSGRRWLFDVGNHV